ncbi:MAG: aspartate/glutamate racemase family protein [Ardenticatenaceae bacterium]|nr:aspartate/glutamate racemase family protein [Anaerolineales bacterium]MCB8939631.1 aspartate/glutamate racemase family protein [Ardenticatenaceae bacterium]MCB8974944.1 aspartate/glutamate racemase family protein [Ardenticatenaceae bacterium]
MAEKWIGVVGGVGPFAGIDLLGKIAAETIANQDQDHLTALNWSQPAKIVDRTEYLLGQVAENPAGALAAQVQQLAQMGADVVGIPCNTAHAPRIFNQIRAALAAANCDVHLLHMIEEVGRFLRENLPEVKKFGVLSTTGTYRAGVYVEVLGALGFTAVLPPFPLQTEKIHPAIYDPIYGIKACGLATPQAQENLNEGIAALKTAGAEAIILGCTELPLAFTAPTAAGLPLIDPTRILARALIREANPAKLKPLI